MGCLSAWPLLLGEELYTYTSGRRTLFVIHYLAYALLVLLSAIGLCIISALYAIVYALLEEELGRKGVALHAGLPDVLAALIGRSRNIILLI